MKKSILILGGCGYIGTKLYQYLLKKKYSVNSIDLEWFGNPGKVKNTKKDIANLEKKDIEKYSDIILLAGHSSVKMCVNSPISAFKNNVSNFIHILSLLKDDQKLIYASSSSVYGNTKNSIVDEEYNDFKPNNFYDLTKKEIDCYTELLNKNIFGLRFGTVNGYSPNFRNDIMINAMTYNAINNKKVFCFNPEVKRPILCIDDLCRCFKAIIDNKNNIRKGIYNLSSFNSNALKISKKVAEITNSNLEIVTEIPKEITNVKLQTKAYNFMIDNSKFCNDFNFIFESDIESIINSIKNNYNKIKSCGRINEKLYDN